ncbi:MAG: cobalt transporter component CbiQ [Actinomycetota bacterium]
MPDSHQHGHQIGDHLFIHRHTYIHDLPPHLKLVAAFSFLLIAVLTPASNYPSFAGYFAIVFALIIAAKLPIGTALKRMVVEIPFVIFAVLMPFLGKGPFIEIAGLTVSEPGLNAGISVLLKSTLGVLISILISSTTNVRDILHGLAHLKVPALLINIATFMLRYSAVITDELHRMKTARESRGFIAKGPRDWKIVAQVAGALFIRSYERGERVHLAMLSRGFNGQMPQVSHSSAKASHWLQVSVLPIAALFVLLIGMYL